MRPEAESGVISGERYQVREQGKNYWKAILAGAVAALSVVVIKRRHKSTHEDQEVMQLLQGNEIIERAVEGMKSSVNDESHEKFNESLEQLVSRVSEDLELLDRKNQSQ